MLYIVGQCCLSRKLWTYATLIGGKFIWVSGATVVGWWFAQSNLQSKQHFDCNWLTGNFEERRMLFWTLQKCPHLQSMPLYLQLFWTLCWFFYLFVFELFLSQKLYFGTAGTFLGGNVQVLVTGAGGCRLGFRGCLAFGRIVRTPLLEVELHRWKLEPTFGS